MTTRTVEIDWEVRSSVGRTVYTAGAEDMATRWLKARREELPGAYVERVETAVTRTRVYSPRLRAVA